LTLFEKGVFMKITCFFKERRRLGGIGTDTFPAERRAKQEIPPQVARCRQDGGAP